MSKRNDLNFSILITMILSFIMMFLIYICYRLAVSIIRTVIYLTGMATIFLFSLFYIGVIAFILYKLITRCNKYKRANETTIDILNNLIKSECLIISIFSMLFVLLSILSILI